MGDVDVHATLQITTLVGTAASRALPYGYQHSAFCGHYRRWGQQLTLSMLQSHTPGERLFIYNAGETVGVTDGTTGEIREAQVFVAVLGTSNCTYLEPAVARLDWQSCASARVLRRLHRTVGADNMRSGVSKFSRYEPDVYPTYHDIAEHHGVAVSPARARRHKDNAKV